MTSKVEYTYECTIDYSVEVERHEGVFSIKLDEEVDDVLSQSINTYMKTKELNMTHFELERLPHDLILGLLTREKPKRISEHSGLSMHDVSDNKSPDMILEKICFELGTSALGANDAYEHKRTKYQNFCETRKLDYYVMGVGPNTVTTNFLLDEEEVSSIVTLYSVGRTVQRVAAISGYVDPAGRDDDTYWNLTFSMKNIDEKLIPKSILNISSYTWQMWSERARDGIVTADHDVYKKLIEHSQISIFERLKERSKKQGIIDADLDYFNSYVSSVDSLPTRESYDEKKISIPFCIVKEGEFDFYGYIQPDLALGELWMEARDKLESCNFKANYEQYLGVSKDLKEESAYRLSKEHRGNMREKNRVKLNLSVNAKEDLSGNGLWGKVMGKKIDKINKQTSFGYSLTKKYNFDDFDSFVNNKELHKFHGSNIKLNLIDELLEVGKFDLDHVSGTFFKDFLNSKLGHCLSFLSSLFSEINLNYRKPTKSNEFYVTTIPNYKAALIIHNTGSSKHSFYSVLIKKEDFISLQCLSCFRPWVDIGDYYSLELTSTRRHDISNYLFCISKAMAMAATHIEVFGEDINFTDYKECFKEFYFHLIVYLQNNNQVSECLQQVRYFYMKTNCSTTLPEPLLSPVEKLPNIIRTRFCCYAIKKLLNCFYEISSNRNKIGNRKPDEEEHEVQESEEPNLAEDLLSGVNSYISNRKLDNYEEALLLSYGGIYHNKEKSDNVTSNLQIYRKLVKEELELKTELIPKYIEGFEVENSLEMPPHGFDSTHLRNCGLNLLDVFKRKGVLFSDLKQRINQSLNKVSYEEMATFKSSLEADHLNINSSESEFRNRYPDLKYDRNAVDKNGKYKYGKTCRAMEGILKVLDEIKVDENVKPFHMISDLINICNKRGGIVAILFKKAQFGSVREIFILTMFARIVVKFVETVARELAELCPNEYLTKGTSKLNSTPTHYNKVNSLKSYDDVVVNLYDSLDCKTWCQNFTFPAFGHLFSAILKDWPELSNTMRVVFNMASSKRHEMTESLMRTFIKNPDVNSMHESMNVLKKEFLADGGVLNTGAQSIFINNVSNFMQGIFHYTSTVLHSSHLLMMSKIIKSYIMYGNEDKFKAVIHTTKASSDDGSSLLSIILKENTKLNVLIARFKLWSASEMLMRSYPLACAWVGLPKSTRFVENGVEEFNSLWTYRNTVLSVPSKFTNAAMIPKITRSCIERQRVDHSSLNACIENGCSMDLVKVLEFGCALNHYITVGLEAHESNIWSFLKDDLCAVPHPASWLYISSPRIAGPTLGFDTSLHNFLIDNDEGQQVQFVMTELLAGSFDIKSGMLIQSSIAVGKTMKYEEFLKRTINTVKRSELLDYLESNPSKLYRESSSLEDVLLKIYLKAESPGAERSFIFEDESALHSISSYLISCPSLTISKKISDSMKWEKAKYTLPSYLQLISNFMTDRMSQVEIDINSETILNMLDTYGNSYLPVGRRRRVPVKIRFPKTRSKTEISLASCAKFSWFAIHNGHTVKQNREAMEEYCTLYPWLQLNHYDTMKKLESMGVEGNIHSIINALLRTEEDKDRTIMFLHTGRKEKLMISSFLSCLEHCQRKNMRLIKSNEVFKKTELNEFLDMERELYPYVTIHKSVRKIMNKKDNKEALSAVKEVFLKNNDLIIKERSDQENRMLPKRLRNLLCISIINSTDNTQLIEDTLLRYSQGYVMSYIKAQKRIEDQDNRVKWVGEGIFFVKTLGVNFRIKVQDSTLLEVASTKPNQITQHTIILSKILKNLGINQDINVSVTDGIRVSGGSVRYSSSRGAPIRELKFTEVLRDVSYTKELKIDHSRGLTLKVGCVTRQGTFLMNPIRFKPAKSPIDVKLTMDLKDAIKLIDQVANRTDPSNNVVKFCVDSLNDRIDRLNMRPLSKTNQFINAAVVKKSDEQVEKEMSKLFDEMIEKDIDFAKVMNIDDILETTEIESDGSSETNEEFKLSKFLDFAVEDMVEEDLLAEIKTIDSSSVNYEDLTIWDEFLDNFESLTKVTMKKAIVGDYLLTEDPKIKNLMLSLNKLEIIEKPSKVELEIDEEDFDLD